MQQLAPTLTNQPYVLPTVLQQVIHKSRYARWNEDAGRREDWLETTARYCNFMAKHLRTKHNVDIEQLGAYDRAFHSIVSLDTMPSMRCMMTAGPALEAEQLCGFNCSALALTDIRVFDEIMYALMCGCGVGFSVERQFIGQLPMIPKRLKPSSETILVEDSRAGWANAFRILIDRLYSGNIPSWNVSKVRLAGARLKTMGGYASGPGPLIDLFKFAIHTFTQATNRRLNSLECHDLICKIGDIVVAGGVRRAALISLSNPSDLRMRNAKMGAWGQLAPWRALANNSACYTERPATGAFMTEWLALYDSKSGERGIVNRTALLEKCRRIGRRTYWDDFEGDMAEDTIDYITNPCFTGDTKVWTIYGPRRFDELAKLGKAVPVLTQLKNGKLAFRNMIKPRRTQRKAMLVEVNIESTSSRKKYRKISTIRCTPNHEFFLLDGTRKAACDLQPKDRLASCYQRIANSKGYLMLKNNHENVMTSWVVCEYNEERRPDYPNEHAHHKDDNKQNNNPDNVEILAAPTHNALNMLGDRNPVRRFPALIRRGKELHNYRNDVNTEEIVRLRKGGLAMYKIAKQLDCSYCLVTKRLTAISPELNHKVLSVKSVATREDVYCGTVPDTGRFFIWCAENEGVLVKNCSEVILRSRETCNLSEIVARPTDTKEVLVAKASMAAMLGTWQATLSNYGYVGKQWLKNAEEERLLGVSITGIMDHPILSNRSHSDFEPTLQAMRTAVKHTNTIWAAKLGIASAAASTCVKPSGTVGILVNSSSGVHSRFAPMYMRRIIMDNNDPICNFLHDCGIPNEPSDYNKKNTVFSFPVRAPVGSPKANMERSATEQLEHWRAINNIWAEHSVSCTIQVDEHEWPQVGGWVWQHFDEISGVSFLPKSDSVYTQMPFEACDEATLAKLEAKMPASIDWNKLSQYEIQDQTNTARELACTGDKCEWTGTN